METSALVLILCCCQ